MDLNNSFDRVRNETPPYVNARIDKYIQGSIQHYADQDRDSVIKRIFELDREWDIDRALMLNFAVAGGTSFAAGLKGNKKWLYFLAAQMVFLGLHALKGWCPPVSLFRRMGFRTRYEIEYEKAALLDILNEKEAE